jgi:hypothetical protein
VERWAAVCRHIAAVEVESVMERIIINVDDDDDNDDTSESSVSCDDKFDIQGVSK